MANSNSLPPRNGRVIALRPFAEERAVRMAQARSIHPSVWSPDTAPPIAGITTRPTARGNHFDPRSVRRRAINVIINAKRLGLALSGAAIAVLVPLGIAQSAQAHGGGHGHTFQGPTRPQHSDTVGPTTSGEPTTSKTPCTRTTTSSATETAAAQAKSSTSPRRRGHRQ